MAVLIIVEGPAKGQKFALEQHELVMIGRDEKCTFQIIDPQISRQHFQVKRNSETNGHLVIDFSSANGVHVNGNRITAETPLANGDLIQMGNTSILYSVENDPDAQTYTQLLRKHFEDRITTQLAE